VILVDTSVWIDHFRLPDRRLCELLADEQVLVHPFVLGELACGNLRNWSEITSLMQTMPVASKAEDEEILLFIERHTLMERGVGLIDVHLLASCFIESCRLWTADQRLKTVAKKLQIVA
jgi:predicted nucleic acid-binding protein